MNSRAQGISLQTRLPDNRDFIDNNKHTYFQFAKKKTETSLEYGSHKYLYILFVLKFLFRFMRAKLQKYLIYLFYFQMSINF